MRSTFVRSISVLAAGAALSAAPALAQQADADAPQVFRVCQDPNNLPFSNTQGEGFENRIAQLFADKLGWKLDYYSFPQRLAFIRNTLRFKLPGEEYRCDVVMGVPANYDQARPRGPITARSTLVIPAGAAGRRETLRTSWHSRASSCNGCGSACTTARRLGVAGLAQPGGPGSALPHPQRRPSSTPARSSKGSPTAARCRRRGVRSDLPFFVKRRPDAGLRLVPLASEPGVRLDFEIAMGVRHSDREWKATLDRLIADNQPQIDAILREFGVLWWTPMPRSPDLRTTAALLVLAGGQSMRSPRSRKPSNACSWTRISPTCPSMLP
jgi:hypothetical protein